MSISPRTPPRPLPPQGTPTPDSPRTSVSGISIVFLERGSSAHAGAGCAAIHLTSTKPESKRQSVPPLDAPSSHSYGALYDGFSAFVGPVLLRRAAFYPSGMVLQGGRLWFLFGTSALPLPATGGRRPPFLIPSTRPEQRRFLPLLSAHFASRVPHRDGGTVAQPQQLSSTVWEGSLLSLEEGTACHSLTNAI